MLTLKATATHHKCICCGNVSQTTDLVNKRSDEPTRFTQRWCGVAIVLVFSQKWWIFEMIWHIEALLVRVRVVNTNNLATGSLIIEKAVLLNYPIMCGF